MCVLHPPAHRCACPRSTSRCTPPTSKGSTKRRCMRTTGVPRTQHAVGIGFLVAGLTRQNVALCLSNTTFLRLWR